MNALPDVTVLPDLPAGTVTFLFTDIEGSTNLLKRLGQDYAQVLAEHHQIIRTAFRNHRGREIGTQGDAFFASFPRASDAAAAVTEIQRTLAQHYWPDGVRVRVRMGLHTGEPWLVEEGYVGMDVHRAARIAHVGHGGQVLLSETTTALIRDDLPDDVTILDLGYHILKDMRHPEHIHQLVIADLPSDFPPIKSLEMLPPSTGTRELEGMALKRKVGPCPYRGLAAFQEQDAPFFHGRESFTERLKRYVQAHNLVAVIVGPSGCGKSSVVSAGLLPEIQEEPGWLVVQMKPRSNPFLSLASALVPWLDERLSGTAMLLESQKLATAIQTGELTLHNLVERILDRDPAYERLLLVIDQFEELFSLTQDDETRHLFIDELLATTEQGASQRRRAPFHRLLALRADFMGLALAHRPFADALQECSLMLGPMNREELQAAIGQPAESQGAAFETGLIERLVSDVGEEPGNLPLLEFALTLLWERMDAGWMTHAIYDEIGRVDGALARYADEIYAGLDAQAQVETRHVFIQLVQPGQGTEDTRRVATRKELASIEWELIQYLADKRLVVTSLNEAGDETVEMVHEVMIRSWERLREWIEADRSFRNWQEGLRANLRQWQAAGRDEGALLRGVPLAEAEEWLAARETDLSQEEASYIQASTAGNLRILARRERRRRYILAGLTAGLIIALGLSVFAMNQRGQALVESDARATQQMIAEAEADARATQQTIAEAESNARATQQALAESEAARAEKESKARATQQAITEQQAREALARNLFSLSVDSLRLDPQLGLLLALEAANQTYPTEGTILPEAQAALQTAIQGVSRLSVAIPAQGSRLPFISFTADGSRLIARYFSSGSDPRNSPEGTSTLVWDAGAGDLLCTLPEGVAVGSWPETPYVGIIDTGEDEIILHLWDPVECIDGTPIRLPTPENVEADELKAVMLSPDANKLVVVWQGRYLDVRDLKSGTRIVTHPLWSMESMANADQWIGGYGFFTNGVPAFATISQDGKNLYELHLYLAGYQTTYSSGPKGHFFGIRSLESGQLLHVAQYEVQDLGFFNSGLSLSPDETMSALMAESFIEVEDDSGATLTFLVASQEATFTAVSFDPESTMLAASSSDGLIDVWEVANLMEDGSIKHLLTLSDPGVSFYDLEFSPDGRWLATASSDGAIMLWGIGPGDGAALPIRSRDLTVIDPAPVLIALSPDGDRIAIADQSGSTAVYDMSETSMVFQLAGDQPGPVQQIDYSPDGSTIATCKYAGPFQIWDAENGAELLRLDDLTEGTCSFDYHQDGKTVALGFFKNGSGWHLELTLPELKEGALVEPTPPRTYEWLAPTDGATTSLAYDDRTSALALTTGDGELFVWDTTATQGGTTGFGGEEVSPESNKALYVREAKGYLQVFLDPTQETLVVTRIDGSITIMDAEDYQVVGSIAAHEGRITVAAFSPDGGRLATSGLDHNLKVWDIETGEALLTLSGQTATISDLAFSPDGKRLYAAREDGTIRPFLLDADELMALAQSKVTRSLTDEECRQYLGEDGCPSP